MSDFEYLKKRRERLIEMLPDNSIAIIASGIAPMRSLDEVYPFSVDRNFYYLTGIDSENMLLVINKTAGRKSVSLYIERFDETLAKWVGGRMLKDEAKEISGIESINYIDEFEGNLTAQLDRTRHCELTVFCDLWRNNINQPDSEGIKISKKIREIYPAIVIKDIYKIMAELRIIKDDFEIECIQKAIEATGKAVVEMMKYTKVGMNECEVEGMFDFALTKQGIREHAFKTIVAGGGRGTTLHYSDNNMEIEKDNLVLTDLGCTYNHYSADITRTYPASGKFTDEQKKVYNIVLGVQKLVIANAKPGKTIRELNDMVIKYYEEELKKAGILCDGEKVTEYYYHNISHQLGLDTHDMSLGNDYPLAKGMVITVEPGLYISKMGIGIRIEDDVLITDGEAKVLSHMIPKETEDLERLLSE
ncbi:MAG: M24 family metallopeptidase [Lachnospiraceae bacterium]|nr:M24 family metallopeptidase [Lachnospiraceae bacterium]